MRNWAGNIAYRARGVAYPASIEELAQLVAATPRIKVLGSRHSFNRIADTEALHVSLEKLPPSITLDRERRTVTVNAHTPYGAFCAELDRNGFALHNLASLPHISVAGACATATHGSGPRHRNLAAAVGALEMITAEGKMIRIARGDADFDLVVVGLGALGIVTRITLDLQPAFQVRQWVYESLSMEKLEEYFEELMSCAYSVSLFTDWRDETFTQVWLKEKIGDETGPDALAAARSTLEANGARAARTALHPVNGDPECCTSQLGSPGPWYERLPHFRMSFTPSAGKELQSEYFVARADARAAIRALRALHAHITPNLLVTEVRTIAADQFLMSPCFQRDSVALHFTWRQNLESDESILPSGLTPEVEGVLHRIEEALDPFDARPHLGKLFAMTPARLGRAYPNLPRFRAAMARFDPEGKFRNEFLDMHIAAEFPDVPGTAAP